MCWDIITEFDITGTYRYLSKMIKFIYVDIDTL